MCYKYTPSVFQIGGSVGDDGFYVDRHADKELYELLKEGELCYVFNSRQMGKSSLLLRCKSKLEKEGYRCCFIDIGRIGSVNVSTPQWYAGIVSELWRGFGLPPGRAMLQWWQAQGDLPPPQKLALFLMDKIFSHYPEENLVVFLDEVDSVLSLPFSADDFFSVIRACYNHRSDDPKLKKLRFAFFGVALAADLIKDPKRTPFNVGKCIRLEGFTEGEAEVFKQGFHFASLSSELLLKRIMWWSRGQPFLTQKLCQQISSLDQELVALNEADLVDDVVRKQILENWEASDNPEHLRTIRDRIQHDPKYGTKVLSQYLQIIEADNKALPADQVDDYSRLYLTGLIAEDHGFLKPRTQIYESIFNQQWVMNELQKQRPYGQKMSLWEDFDHDPQWLLQGEDLSKARLWTEDKHLSEVDHRFLAASQELESNRFKEWNKQLQQEIDQRKKMEGQLQLVLAELEKAKRDAEEANQAKSEFITRVSREVGTQVNSVLGFSHIASQLNHTDVRQAYLQKILSATRYMHGVVNGIIDIEKIETGDLSFNHESFCLDDVLEDLIDTVGFRFSKDSLQLNLDLPGQFLPILWGDPSRLKQLLLNLLLFCWSRCQGDTIQLGIVAKQNAGQGNVMEIEFVASYRGDLTPTDTLLSVQSPALASNSKTVGFLMLVELTRLMGGRYSTSTTYPPDTDSDVNQDLLSIPETALQLVLNFECELYNQFVPEKKLRVALALAQDSPLKLASHIEQIGHHCQSVDLASAEPLEFRQFDVLMIDEASLARQFRILRIMDANPLLKLVPIIAVGTRLPQWLMLVNIRYQLNYPYSIARLRNTLDFPVDNILDSDPYIECAVAEQYDVLVAEADEVNQLIITELLLTLGLKVNVVSSDQEALEAVCLNHYDLILLAVDLPTSSARETAEKIRTFGVNDNKNRQRSMPVIAITSASCELDQDSLEECGFNDHLSEPLNPQIFFKVVTNWLPKAQCKDSDLDSLSALAVAGVDTKAGLASCSANFLLYKVALKRFSIAYRDGFSMTEEQELTVLAMKFRAIRLSSGYLGAVQITALAAKLETTANFGTCPEPGDVDVLSRQLVSLSAVIDLLCANLNRDR